MDCEFCSVTAFNGRRYRQRPVQEVVSELESIPQKLVFFVDDNIIGYGKPSQEQAKELFREMARRKLSKLWFCQASLNSPTTRSCSTGPVERAAAWYSSDWRQKSLRRWPR